MPKKTSSSLSTASRYGSQKDYLILGLVVFSYLWFYLASMVPYLNFPTESGFFNNFTVQITGTLVFSLGLPIVALAFRKSMRFALTAYASGVITLMALVVAMTFLGVNGQDTPEQIGVLVGIIIPPLAYVGAWELTQRAIKK